jgi:phage baseplate assembly protein W
MKQNVIKYADMSKVGKNLTNQRAVLDAIINILYTRKGSLPHRRDFGSELENYLFRPYSFITARQIYAEVKYAITRWEPRATILKETDVIANPDTRRYTLILHIEVEGFPEPLLYEEELTPKVTS